MKPGFLKGGSNSSIELTKAGAKYGGTAPRDFQYSTVSKLNKLLYFMPTSRETTIMVKVKCVVLGEGTKWKQQET